MPLDERNVPLPPDNATTGRHHGACSARLPGAAVTAR